MEWILPAAVVVLAILALAVRSARLGRRKEGAADVAARLGLAFSRKAEPEELGIADLPLFTVRKDSGLLSRPRNVLSGTLAGTETLVFDDVHYQRRDTKRRSQTVACFRRDAPGPDFRAVPEDLGRKLAARLGAQDVDLPAHPGFSRLYTLQGSDPEALREHFGRGPAAFLEAHPEWAVEAAGAWVAVYRPRRTVPPGELPPFLEEASTVFRTVVGR